MEVSFMRLVFIILLIVLVVIILLFTVALKVKVVVDTCKTNLNMTFLWLHSFLKALVTIEDTKPMVTLYLLNKKLFKRKLKTGKGKDEGKGKFSNMDFVKLVDYRDVHVDAQYGFRDPFTTGITCGAINAATQFINIDSINQAPDFATDNDYIYLDARAKVNMGSTLIKFLKLKH
jgi:hypothetical protein